MKRRLIGIATGLLMAGLIVPLGACAGTAKAPARFETAQRKANGSGIDVSYQVQAATAPGQTVRVTLILNGVTDPTGASVRLAADGGLVLQQDGAPRALTAGQATTLEVDVTLLGTATGYLSVFTTQHGVGSVTSIRVPVGAGTAASVPSTHLKATPEGEKLIVIPVK